MHVNQVFLFFFAVLACIANGSKLEFDLQWREQDITETKAIETERATKWPGGGSKPRPWGETSEINSTVRTFEVRTATGNREPQDPLSRSWLCIALGVIMAVLFSMELFVTICGWPFTSTEATPNAETSLTAKNASAEQTSLTSNSTRDFTLPFFVKRWYSMPPCSKTCFTVMVTFYVYQAINLALAILAYRRNDVQTCVILVCSIMAANLFIAPAAYAMYDVSNGLERLDVRQFMLYLLDLDRFVEAWQYLIRGEEPRWKIASVGRPLEFVFRRCPILAVNLHTLVSGLALPGFETFLILVSLAATFTASIAQFKFLHINKGAPYQEEKYRLFDLDAPNAATQMLLVFVVDTFAVFYRVGMVSLLYISAGLANTVAFVLVSWCVRFVLLWSTFAPPLSQLLTKFGVKYYTLCSCSAFVFSFFDPAFEPTPFVSVYLRIAPLVRAVEACTAACMIASCRDVLLAWPRQHVVHMVMAFSLLSMIIHVASFIAAFLKVFRKQQEENSLIVSNLFAMVVEWQCLQNAAGKQTSDRQQLFCNGCSVAAKAETLGGGGGGGWTSQERGWSRGRE